MLVRCVGSLALAALVAAAPAPALEVAPLPTVPVPTVPTVPVPPVPPVPPPTVPAPVPAPLPPSEPVPAPPAIPAPPVAPAGSSGGDDAAVRPSAPGAGAGPASTPRAKRRTSRPAVTLSFRSRGAERVELVVRQVAPRCRVAGRIAVATRAPTTTLRFDGRVGGRALGDGTYVVETPSRSVRFAIVDGRPTLARGSFAASTCAGGGAENGVATAAPAAGSRPKPARLEPAAAAAAELRRPEPRRVLGVAFEDAAEAALGLHPALYALLALAIALLATASVPAARVPSAGAAAILARRRADLTLAGLLTLMVVVAGCLITLV